MLFPIRPGLYSSRSALDGAASGWAGGGGGGTATWDAAHKNAATSLDGTLLIATAGVTGDSYQNVLGTSGHALGTAGKYYFEITYGGAGGAMAIGLADYSAAVNFYLGSATLGTDSVGWTGSNIFLNGSSILAVTDSPAAATLISIAVDMGAKKMWVRLGAGVWNNSGGDPTNASTGGGADISGLNAGTYFPAITVGTSGQTGTVNFGGSAYSGTKPTGYGNW